MDARRLRALVIGGAAVATLAVGGVVAADPVPDAPAAPAADPLEIALESLEARAATELAQAEAAARNRSAPSVAVTRAPTVVVTQAAPVTQSASS